MTWVNLPAAGLRDCQINAIARLEKSFKNSKPRALIQMATGSGKTYTAITFVYRLLKYTQAKRILFLVDTKNLGEQAEQEFMAYLPNDDNRKFTELYAVHRLKSKFIPDDNHVYISTIQRLYAVLKGQDLEESAEEENPNERWQPKVVPPVEYNEKLPPEYFDFIVIDECHRSIYNLWMQVLDYFDAFQVGLTATPDKRTFAYFQQNIVSEYSHEMAVADGVNVGYDVYLIETKISKQGATLWKGAYIEHRERLSRKKRLQLQDEDEIYSSRQIEELFSSLDKGIENLKTAQAQLKTYRQAVLKWAFEGKLTNENVKEGELPEGWKWAKISDFLFHHKKGMATGPFGTALKKNEHKKSGVPVLGIENIGEGTFQLPNKIFVSKEKAAELNSFRVAVNDIIISRSGTIGEICCVPEAFEDALISTNLIRVRLNQNLISSKYFVFLFQGGAVREQVKELCKGSTRAFLNQTILNSL